VAASAAAVAMLGLAAPAAAIPTPTQNFLANGTTLGGCTFPAPVGGQPANCVTTGDPPDPNGAVGPNHYVQTVNGGYAVWGKNGALLRPPKLTNTLWSGYSTTDGNACATENDGDPIVRYDRLADRWLITQFDLHNFMASGTTGPSFQCVAVSRTPDPAGAYYLYDFKYTAAVNDYAKVGVWPDAYYVSYNEFNPNLVDSRVCAWDRAKMLAGQPATQQCFTTSTFGLLPADFDGSLPPPAGEPEYFAALGSSTSLDLFKFHVDWTNPGNSTFSSPPTALTVPAYTQACNVAACVAQPSPGNALDSLGDRLMYRLQYRNFGTHESLLANHSVTAGTSVGVRWYELRNLTTTPTVFQQGTYAPDSSYRWMGSIAQDQAGDIALGYTLSSSTIKPSVALTGRLAGDAAGQMGQGEATIVPGGGVETGTFSDGTPANRWGDYSAMTVDPTDDCTFWYTNEYYPSNGIFNWDTHIASFKFPNCGANNFSIAPSPASATVPKGSSGTTAISTANTAGTPESATLTAQDLPAGATASFSPASVTAGNSSTLTLTTDQSTPVGTYTITVAGTAPSAVHGSQLTLTVNPSHTLTVTKSTTGSGTVTSSPAGIGCGSSCSSLFSAGSPVTLTATPDPGSVFLGWSGDCSGSSCGLTMDSNKAVTAGFDGQPVCTDVGGLATPYDMGLAVALACSDPDSGDTISYSIVSGPAHGTLSAVDSTGHVTYAPSTGYSGPDAFTVKSTDNHSLDSNTATVSISVGAPAPPSCSDLSASVAHDTPKSIALACSHVNPRDAIAYAIASGPSHGTLGPIDPAGNVTYAPKAGYGGADSFTYRSTDSHGQLSNTATVTMKVDSNRPPTCTGQTVKVVHGKGRQVSLGCTDSDRGQRLHWTIVTKPSHGRLSTISGSGRVTYTPKATFAGSDRFVFKAIDSEGGGSRPTTITLRVAGPNCSKLKGRQRAHCKAKLKHSATAPPVRSQSTRGPLLPYRISQRIR
jgi:hypothetical protein